MVKPYMYKWEPWTNGEARSYFSLGGLLVCDHEKGVLCCERSVGFK